MKTIKTLVKEQIAQEQSYINEHNEVLKVLEPLEGKQFNFRTFNEKSLKGFEFKSQYGMFYIIGTYQHLIGYRETEGINIEAFKKWDACNGRAAQERIEKLKALDVKELQKISNKIKKSFNELRYLFGEIEDKNLGSFDNPIYYNMLKNIYDEDQNTRAEIRLHNFYYIKLKK